MIVKGFLASLLLFMTEVFCKESDINMINDINDEAVLKAMKNSGVVSDMEQKLRSGQSSSLSSQDRNMLISFIEEYKADNKKAVTNDHILEIVDIIVKNRKPNLPQIFVQLGPVIDVLAQLETKSKPIKIIIAQQAEVLESSKSIKEIFTTFTSNLNRELLKAQIHPDHGIPKKEKPSKNNGFLETLLQEFFKNKNPLEMMSLMNGDVSALANILADTDLLKIVQTIINSYISGSPYGPIIQQYITKFLESDQGETMMSGMKEFVAAVATSESGQRMLKLAPQLMAAKNMQSMMEILGKEVEYNWRLFFSQLLNSSYKKDFINAIAEMSVKAHDYVMNPPKNSPINQLPIILNGVLMSYKMPSYDPKAPAKSMSAILNKSIRLISTSKIDTAPAIDTIYNAVTEAISKHIDEAEYKKLRMENKISLVSGLLEAEMVHPILKVWNVYLQAADQPKCASKFLCEINRLEKVSENKRVGVVKAASYGASWTLSKSSQEMYWKYYHAVNAGSMGADCEASYPTPNCKLNLNGQISHIEL